jgi:hypothetical protein
MKKKLLGLSILAALTLGMVGCEELESTPETATEVSSEKQMDVGANSVGMEMRMTEKNQKNLNKSQPPIQIDWSLERENLNQRIKRWNDPNKISYIYLLGENGNTIAYFPIKGKVSSVNSKLSTNLQIVKDPNTYYENDGSLLMESPDFDGSYGTNGDAIFFYLTDGTYMEWPGKYLLSENPVKLSQQPLMTYTKTDK